MKPTLHKLWNTRGRIIEVSSGDEITHLRKGYLRLTPEESAKHKVGDYSPIYDKGADAKMVISPEPPPALDRRTTSPDTLRVDEV